MKLTKEDIVRARCDIDVNAEELAKRFQPIFAANKWTWSSFPEPRVPTEEDIDIELRVLAGQLYAGHQRALCSCGRLEIEVSKSITGWVSVKAKVIDQKHVSSFFDESSEVDQ